MDKQQSGSYRTHSRARASSTYRPPTCEDATATDMSDSQPEMATRQHQRQAGVEPRPPLQRSATTGPGTGRYAAPPTTTAAAAAVVGPAYQQSGYTAHPFAPVTTTYNPLFGNASMPMNYPTSYQTPGYSGRYASNTSIPYSYAGQQYSQQYSQQQQQQQPPFVYPTDTGYPDPRRYSYSNDDYYTPEPATQYPTSRLPPPAPRPPRQNYGYEPRSATPAPKTAPPPPPAPPKKNKAPARQPAPAPAPAAPSEDKRVIKREISKLKKQMAKLEVEHEDLRSDTGRVRSEFLLPSASLAGRSNPWESVQTLEHIRRLIDDCLRKTTAAGSSSYTDSRVDAIEALIMDKMAFERRDSMEPRDDRSFAKRVIEVLQDYETQNGRWERRSGSTHTTTREEKRRSGGQRSTTSSDPPLEPVTPPSSYSVPQQQRTGKETTDHVYDAARPVRRGSTRAAVHSDEDDGVPRPPRTRRPEEGGTGRRRRQSMVEPERGSYGIAREQQRRTRAYAPTSQDDEEYAERRPTTAAASSYSDRRRRPTSYGGGRFRTDPTSAPSESTRWSREGGF